MEDQDDWMLTVLDVLIVAALVAVLVAGLVVASVGMTPECCVGPMFGTK